MFTLVYSLLALSYNQNSTALSEVLSLFLAKKTYDGAMAATTFSASTVAFTSCTRTI